MRVAGFILSSNRFSLLKIKLLNIHNDLFADFAISAPFMVLTENLLVLVCLKLSKFPLTYKYAWSDLNCL